MQPFPGNNTLFLKAGVHKIVKPIVPLLVAFLKISSSIPTINQFFVILSNLPKFFPSMHMIKVPHSMFVRFSSLFMGSGNIQLEYNSIMICVSLSLLQIEPICLYFLLINYHTANRATQISGNK